MCGLWEYHSVRTKDLPRRRRAYDQASRLSPDIRLKATIFKRGLFSPELSRRGAFSFALLIISLYKHSLSWQRMTCFLLDLIFPVPLSMVHYITANGPAA